MAKNKFTREEKSDLKTWRRLAEQRIDWDKRISPKRKEATRMNCQEYAFAVVIVAMCERLGIR